MPVELRVLNPQTGRMMHFGLFDDEAKAWAAVDARCARPSVEQVIPTDAPHAVRIQLGLMKATFAPMGDEEFALRRVAWRAQFEVGEPRRFHAFCNGCLADTFDDRDQAESHADNHAATISVIKAVRFLGAAAVSEHRRAVRATWKIVDTHVDFDVLAKEDEQELQGLAEPEVEESP